ESRGPGEKTSDVLDSRFRGNDDRSSAGVTMLFRRAATRGQATTEVVLLMPLFMFFLFAFAKIFAMLLLVQKLEIASYYAARRWQLESHRNVAYEGFDANALCSDIERQVACYIGFVRQECPG